MEWSLLGARALVAVASLAAAASAQTTVRVSAGATGAQANGGSGIPSMTPDGRFVAFDSGASNLVPGDLNGHGDVFVRDRQTGAVERVSVASDGTEANGFSWKAWISADGRHVAFESLASNLVPGDTHSWDVFVHDRATGVTERVSVSATGAQADGECHDASISDDGRYVAFWSPAKNLVPGDANLTSDVFVKDRWTGAVEIASVNTAGAQANGTSGEFAAISGDGRCVVFDSRASNLVAGDVNGNLDVFVRDRVAGTTECVSVTPSGVPGNGMSGDLVSISADGRHAAFASYADDLVGDDTNGVADVFVRDRVLGVTQRVSLASSGVQGDADSMFPSISADGGHVAFFSWASSLVAGDWNGLQDAFVHDRATGSTQRVSVSTSGAECGSLPNDSYWAVRVSSGGRFAAFDSSFDALVPGDTNGAGDVFVRDRSGCSPELAIYCTAKVNSAGCTPAISSSGSPSASAGSGFVIAAEQVLDQHAGILFYGTHGPNDARFFGGFLCVTGPLRRTPAQTAGPGGAPPCAGTYALDFNAWIAGGADAALAAGQPVWAQYWTRDGVSPPGTGLTDALTFVICH